jgi:hypothetical protein
LVRLRGHGSPFLMGGLMDGMDVGGNCGIG